MVRCTLRRSFAKGGVAFKTGNRSEKKKSEEKNNVGNRREQANTRPKAWEREARKAKKAGKFEKAQKKKKKRKQIPFLFIT